MIKLDVILAVTYLNTPYKHLVGSNKERHKMMAMVSQSRGHCHESRTSVMQNAITGDVGLCKCHIS